MEIERRSGIYKITNLINGKKYIGSAVNLKRRKYIHFLHLKKEVHCNVILQNAFNKYGKDYFVFEVLEFVDDKGNLITREQYYIDLYQSFVKANGYNISPTAGSTMGVPAHNKGIPNSEATRLKISIANTGKTQSRETIERRIKSKLLRGTGKHTEESKRKISQGRIGVNNPFFGKKHSEESKRKISGNLLGDKNPFFGKTHSDEFRKKSSLIHKGKVVSKETKERLSKALKGKKQSGGHVMKRIAARLVTLKNNKEAC